MRDRHSTSAKQSGAELKLCCAVQFHAGQPRLGEVLLCQAVGYFHGHRHHLSVCFCAPLVSAHRLQHEARAFAGCAVLCRAVLCRAVLCCVVQSCAVLCCAVLCGRELCCAAQCHAVLMHIELPCCADLHGS